jgi:hypothetical protein
MRNDGLPLPLGLAPRSREQGFRCYGVKFREMSVWVWIAIGVGSFLVLSLFVGLAVAAVLGDIGRRVSGLYETEDWATAPPARALKDAGEPQPEEVKTKRGRVVRLR